MTARQAMAFVARHGIVLESAHVSGARIPVLADAIAGARIRGNWWAHPKGKPIFALTRAVRDADDVMVCRLVDGRITYVHRRLWPALVRLAREIGRRRVDALQERHTRKGQHVIRLRRFPLWVDHGTRAAAGRLSERAARRAFARCGYDVAAANSSNTSGRVGRSTPK
jgi:hypothetical protein